MEKKEIVEVIAGIVRDILHDKTLSLIADTAPEDVDGWDSVTHVNLVAAFEEKYDVKLSLREIMPWKTVGDLADTILNEVQNG